MSIIAGMPHYSRDTYERMREILSQSHKLPASYDEWLDGFKKGFQQATLRGYRVEQINIHPDVFTAWCKANVRHADYESLRLFVNFTVAQVHGGVT